MIIIGLVANSEASQEAIVKEIKQQLQLKNRVVSELDLKSLRDKTNGMAETMKLVNSMHLSPWATDEVLILLNVDRTPEVLWIEKHGGQLWFAEMTNQLAFGNNDRFVTASNPALMGKAFIKVQQAFDELELRYFKKKEAYRHRAETGTFKEQISRGRQRSSSINAIAR